MSGLRLFLLGPPRIERGDERIEIGLRKSVGLLAYLALTEQEHGRDFLAALLWPEQPPGIALGNLRRAIYRINQQLGDGLLVTTRTAVALASRSGVWSDAGEFREHVGACLGAEQTSEKPAEACIARLTRAVDLYADDLLAGFSLPDSLAFDDWLFFEREGLRHSLGDALDRLAQAHQSLSEWDQAIAYARKRVALDPLHEPAHRLLIALYSGSNQLAAAARQYNKCRDILKEQLDVAPEAETTALYEAIRIRQVFTGGRATDTNAAPALPAANRAIEPGSVALAPTDPANHNLWTHPVPFVGRTEELKELKRLVAGSPQHRLVTITGPGGIGKTRLAVEAGRQALPAFPDGVWFVCSTPLASARNLAAAVSRTLGSELPGEHTDHGHLLSFICDKRQLLILDNFEHLLPDTTLIRNILEKAPGVKILVTSRENLNLSAETVYPLGPLTFPARGVARNAQDFEAVHLMVQVARRMNPSMKIDEQALQQMARIARLVEGMPLAILLSAAWLQALSLGEIGDEIEKSPDFLETKLLDLPERQHSVRAAFEYSWNRLTVEDKKVFARLSVFRGSFTRPAAQRVAGASLRAMRSLIGKSCLSVQGAGRYYIHELLRRYGEESLERSGEAVERRSAHAHEYLTALAALRPALEGRRSGSAIAQIEADFRNIDAAWDWAVRHKAAALIDAAVESLYLFWANTGRESEGTAMLQRTYAELAPDPSEPPNRVSSAC